MAVMAVMELRMSSRFIVSQLSQHMIHMTTQCTFDEIYPAGREPVQVSSLVSQVPLVVILFTRQEVVLRSQELAPVKHPPQAALQLVETAEAEADFKNVARALQLAVHAHIHEMLSEVCLP